MTTLVLLALQLTPPAPNCAWATELLHFAVGHHVSVETYSSLEAERARHLALAAIRRDANMFTASELEEAAAIVTKGSPADDALAWWNGDCSKFEAFANLRERAVARLDRIVQGAPRSLASKGEVEDRVARVYEAMTSTFSKDAPLETAEQFARGLLQRSARDLRAEQGSWAFVTMVKAAVGSLDPHSDFSLHAHSPRASFAPGRGRFGVQMAGNGMTPWGHRLDAPMAGTSAARPDGLHEGDLLTSVDGESTVGLWRNEISRLFDRRGDEVRVTVTRVENLQPVGRRTVVLRRGPRIEHPLQAQTVIHFGVAIRLLTVRRFSVGIARDISAALDDGREADVVVLDLRGNPGGLLQEGLSTLSLFDAEAASVKLRRAGEVWISRGHSLPMVWEGPVIVVVDANSGSASELVAGTLQARGRAVVLSASPTWGKGTVQLTFSDPTEATTGELVITTSQLFLADGHSPQCDGISPDVRIEGPARSATRECDEPGALAAAVVEPFLGAAQETRRQELRLLADELARTALPWAPDEAVLEFAARFARRTQCISAE